MKSEWRVSSNLIDDTKVYGVYRLIDRDGVDHSGNRETFPYYNGNRKLALDLANGMNEEEKK